MLRAEAYAPWRNAAAFCAAQIARRRASGLDPITVSDTGAIFATPYGLTTFDHDGEGLRLVVEAPHAALLETEIQTLTMHLAREGGASGDWRWRGDLAAAGEPANFAEATLLRRAPLTPGAMTLTFAAKGLARYVRYGSNARMLIPAESVSSPQWPMRNLSGKLVMPEGARRLHRRMIALRRVRPDAGEFDVTLMRRDGEGALAAFAETAQPGVRVGLLGPVGRAPAPPPGWLILGGDEAAAPWMARVLEGLDRDREGHATILLRDEAHRRSIDAPPGVVIDWLTGDDETLVRAIKAIRPPTGAQPVGWFGGEAAAAQEVQRYFRDDLGLRNAHLLSSTFWRRGRPQ